MTYTLEAERYGEWVQYHFTPNANAKGEVHTAPSFGPAKTIPVQEARRLWSALIRKGWTIQADSGF